MNRIQSMISMMIMRNRMSRRTKRCKMRVTYCSNCDNRLRKVSQNRDLLPDLPLKSTCLIKKSHLLEAPKKSLLRKNLLLDCLQRSPHLEYNNNTKRFKDRMRMMTIIKRRRSSNSTKTVKRIFREMNISNSMIKIIKISNSKTKKNKKI